MRFFADGTSVRKLELVVVPGVRIDPVLGGDPGERSKVEIRTPEFVRIVDSETTRIRCGRFLILGGMAGAASGFPGTIISSEFGMALLAERDLSMGCAPLMERFFFADEGLGVVKPVEGIGELVFRERSCFGFGTGEG
jgi:hypothetical protein